MEPVDNETNNRRASTDGCITWTEGITQDDYGAGEAITATCDEDASFWYKEWTSTATIRTLVILSSWRNALENSDANNPVLLVRFNRDEEWVEIGSDKLS